MKQSGVIQHIFSYSYKIGYKVNTNDIKLFTIFIDRSIYNPFHRMLISMKIYYCKSNHLLELIH